MSIEMGVHNTIDRTVTIALQERSYPIEIGQGLLVDPCTYQDLPDATSVVVVTNTTVQTLYAAKVVAALQTRYRCVHTIVLPDGEQYKTWESMNHIFGQLLHNGCDRKTILFALGGGVIGDMTGFAAAAFMRGVRFVQLPTTLLAQVDSSVGGKTGINHPLGKNMIGAFHQPIKVICDMDVLQTLPKRELSAGLAEVIKYGPIADPDFLEWLHLNIDQLMCLEPNALAHAIERSCHIKASVVGADEREDGIRAILNFGHTFGHAIEAGMGYGAWLHGEAVGAGMVMAACLSQTLGLIQEQKVSSLTALIGRAGLPIRSPLLDSYNNVARYLELMRLDKKSLGGDIRFVVIHDDGSASLRQVPDAVVQTVIEQCCA